MHTPTHYTFTGVCSVWLRPLNQNDESKRESLVCLTSTGCRVILNWGNLRQKTEFIQNHLFLQTLLPETLVSPSRAPSSKLTVAIKEEHLTVDTHRHLSHDDCVLMAQRFLLYRDKFKEAEETDQITLMKGMGLDETQMDEGRVWAEMKVLHFDNNNDLSSGA